MAGEQILVVDDGRENREFVVEYVLEPNGYQAMTARDGLEGFEMAMEHLPDLILLDLQMPRMNGMQVIESLAQHNMNIPIILMTFHGSEEIAIEAYRMGVRDYVKKPYSIDEMLAAVERSLTEVRLRKEKEALMERVLQANRELQRRLQELNVLYSVGKSVTALMELDRLLTRIVDAATQITGAEESHIHLLQGDKLICRAHKRPNTARAVPVNLEMNDRAALHVLETGQPLAMTPEQLAELHLPDGGPVAVAYAPLTLKNAVIGVLGVDNVTPGSHAFSKHDAALLSALTDYAAISIENARNFGELKLAKEREKAQIRDAFEKFVPPSVVDRALYDPGAMKLGGKRQEISVLFADIRGYTTWSENAPPEQVVEMLNDYLSLAAEVILSWGGTLDKFLGDGLMAVFNAPDVQSDHVHRATDAALALMSAAEEKSRERGDTICYSVGVAVGDAVVGNIGTQRAMNYTAIGDTVNLAKRLQEYAAPKQILVEEEIVKRLGNRVQVRALGEVKLKGRKKQSFAYELLGLD